jgi:hypothetical protein
LIFDISMACVVGAGLMLWLAYAVRESKPVGVFDPTEMLKEITATTKAVAEDKDATPERIRAVSDLLESYLEGLAKSARSQSRLTPTLFAIGASVALFAVAATLAAIATLHG